MPKNKGFTLVELLTVIVILAVILVIAVPQIMNVITESRKGVLESSAKLIASSAETKKVSNDTLGIEEEITCSDVAQLTSEDYTSCSIKFVDGKAKVTIVGKGKFEGMSVCYGTKEDAKVVEECPGPVSFADDSWETIASAVQEGDTENYNVGDTKTVDLGTLGTHTLRIANKSNDWEYCGVEGYSQTTCGFVVEFADIIIIRKMNDTSTNVGGWPASQLYDYINVTEETGSGTIYNALVSVIGDVIIKTKVVSSHGSGDTTGTLANNNFESGDYLYLLSPREVYGTSFAIRYDKSNETSRQLDYYKNNNISTSSNDGAIKNSGNSAYYWWLRSANSNNDGFFGVSNGGNYTTFDAVNMTGVSPAFRLG